MFSNRSGVGAIFCVFDGQIPTPTPRDPCYDPPMLRVLLFICITFTGSLTAGESSMPVFPQWDGAEPVAAYAKKVNLPPTRTLELGNGVKLELVLIPAGKFLMGTPEREKPVVGQTMTAISGGILLIVVAIWLLRARRNRKRPQFSISLMLAMTFVAAFAVWGGVRWNEAVKHPDIFPSEHPAHDVTLTQPFYLGKYDVTQDQYQAVTRTNLRYFTSKDSPADYMTWDDATAFCQKATAQTNENFRLPTEAEWEYACRAGTRTEYYSGDTEADLARAGWYDQNSGDRPHPVGAKDPNAFGLYDMHGNVWQWCQDWFAEDYYSTSESANPRGPNHGVYHVLRGGSNWRPSASCRSANREGKGSGGPANVGFRVALSVR